MEIDGNSLISAYDSYVQQVAGNAASGAASVSASKDYSKASDAELMDACKQFEAYFLEQCFKEMMKTVKTEETSGSMSTLVDYYKDEMVQRISSQATETQSLGLAQTLYEQMKRNYNL